MWIWPLGPLLLFLKGPPNTSKTKIFKNNNLFCFTLSHWAYLPKNMFLSPKLRLLAINNQEWQDGHFSKMIFFLTFLCHIEPAYQEIMSLYPQLCLLAFRALFENKRDRKANFQKPLKVPSNGVIKTPCGSNKSILQNGRRLIHLIMWHVLRN